jgi:hypothetical protein
MTVGAVLGNVMWPGLVAESGLIALWAVVLGIIAEWPFLRWLSSAGWGRSLWMTITINAVSCGIGYILNPLAGLIFIIPHDLFSYILSIGGGTFSPSGWIFTYHGIVLATASLEYLVFRGFFDDEYFSKRQLTQPSRKKTWLAIWLANLVSVAIGFCFISAKY